MTKRQAALLEKEEKMEVPTEYLETAAYYFWLSRGCPIDDAQTDWEEAEKQWRIHSEGASVQK
jgi:hypothetical protein